MPGTASVASARTSIYHTAQSSSPNDASTSPLAFWTPAPTRAAVTRIEEEDEEDDDTPRATAFQYALNQKNTIPGSSPMLHRYIDQYAATEQDTPSAVTSMTATPRTRLQARLMATKTSSPAISTRGSPATSIPRKTRGSSVTPSTPRAFSPLVKQNMLAETTPHSISYENKVKSSVEEVVKSLTRRGRAKEGLALQALYSQSFKDAGTAELLDALLRQRANDRQKRDFARYVEDISKLGSQPSIRQNSSQPLAEEQGMDENVEVMSEILPPDYVRPPSPRVVIEVPAQDLLRRITVTRHTQILGTRAIQQEDSLRETDLRSATSSTISPLNPSFQVDEQMTDRTENQVTLQRSEAATSDSSTTLPSVPAPNELSSSAETEQTKHEQQPAVNNQPWIKPITKVGQHHAPFNSGLKKFTPDFNVLQTRERRRRKHKKRLFAAANGPVFSRAFIT